MFLLANLSHAASKNPQIIKRDRLNESVFPRRRTKLVSSCTCETQRWKGASRTAREPSYTSIQTPSATKTWQEQPWQHATDNKTRKTFLTSYWTPLICTTKKCLPFKSNKNDKIMLFLRKKFLSKISDLIFLTV